MKKVTIYHNNRCSKSRQALEILIENTPNIELVKYIDEPISRDVLISLLEKLGYSADELLRKNEKAYKELIKGRGLSEDAMIDLMIENPKIIERPIVICENKALVARPPERVKEFFT